MGGETIKTTYWRRVVRHFATLASTIIAGMIIHIIFNRPDDAGTPAYFRRLAEVVMICGVVIPALAALLLGLLRSDETSAASPHATGDESSESSDGGDGGD